MFWIDSNTLPIRLNMPKRENLAISHKHQSLLSMVIRDSGTMKKALNFVLVLQIILYNTNYLILVARLFFIRLFSL